MTVSDRINFINMSSESNNANCKTAVEEPQVRQKKIAAKSFQLKSPSPQPKTNGNSSSSESFKSAVATEVVVENDINSANHDDVIPPARLVSSLSSPAALPSETAKKGKSATKPLPKKKANLAKSLKSGFWEIESLVDVRKNGNRYEFLVQWKGDYENTWEPEKNLNKNASKDARELKAKMQQQQNELGVAASSATTEVIQNVHE